MSVRGVVLNVCSLPDIHPHLLDHWRDKEARAAKDLVVELVPAHLLSWASLLLLLLLLRWRLGHESARGREGNDGGEVVGVHVAPAYLASRN